MSSLEILTLPFVRSALAAGILVSISCSYLGVFMVLRRTVFVGIALAQLAALGVALSFYLPAPPEVLALATTLIGALLLGSNVGGRFVPREARIGFLYVAAVASSTLLVAKSADGEAHVLGLLFGNILTVTDGHLWILLVVTVLVLLLHAAFYKQILFASFDPETARAAGFRVRGWNALFDLSLALVIAVGLHEAGSLLVFSYLVQPALAGLLLASSMRGVIQWAIGLGLAATLLGVAGSVLADLPTGPSVVAVNALFVVIAMASHRVARASGAA